MPRYNCRCTEVQFCTWDPPSPDGLVPDFLHPATAINSYSTSGSGSNIVPGVPISHKAVMGYEPAQCYKLNTLKEEFFTSCEGLDFLGCDIPFFLIQVGRKDLSGFEVPRGIENSSFSRCSSYLESSETPLGFRALNTSSVPARIVPDISCLGVPVNAGDVCQNELSKFSSFDLSSLSDPSSAAFISPDAAISRAKDPGAEISNQTHPCAVTWEQSKITGNYMNIPVKASAIESGSKPILIKIKLSDKSFINPLSDAKADHCDICINIFYNGELNTSQVVQYSAWAAQGQQSLLSFGGRRIDTCRELPWILVTEFQNISNPEISRDVNSKAFLALERWNKLAEMLLIEADEWGRDERGYRCPTGEYLELLSRKGIPPELLTASSSMGGKFGTIDIIITFGRGPGIDNAELVVSPLRNLSGQSLKPNFTEDTSGTAISALATVADLFSTTSDRMGLTNPDTLEHRAISTDTRKSPSIIETTHGAVSSAQPSGQMRLITATDTGVGTIAIRGASSEALVQQATSRNANTLDVLAKSSTPRPYHPHKPPKVPQKRYRGSEPILPEPKRQKAIGYLGEVPLNLNSSTCISTRSTRSASTPFPRAFFSQFESNCKEKGSVKQIKGGLVSTKSSAFLPLAAPSTPKKREINGPKTPDSNGSVKKHARTTHFNSKYSNRPQNLRRKNSKGEWFIPVSRKNNDGEWETPTKNQRPNQVFGINSPGQFTNEIIPEDTKKILQPVFTALKYNSDREISAGLKITAEPQMVIDPDIPKEDVSQMIMLRRTGALAVQTRILETQFPSLTSRLQNVESYPNGEALGSTMTEDLETFQSGNKDNSAIAGIEKEPRKKSLRIRFSRADNFASDEAIDTASTRIRQVVRYASPEYIATPAGLGIIPGTTVNPAPRDIVFDNTKQPQTFNTLKSQPRFMVPNHNFKVLKLANRQGVATESEVRKQTAIDQDVYQSLPNENFASNASHDPDTIHVRHHLAAYDKFSWQTTELKNSSAAQPVMTASSKANSEYDMKLIKLEKPTQASESEARPEKGDLTPGQLPTGLMSKPPPRPRTVGSSELKALLESHDCGNAITTSPSAPLGVMHTQHLTRATRKAVSYNVTKAIAPNDDTRKSQVQSNIPSAELPGTSKSAAAKHDSSVGVTGKTVIATLPRKDTVESVSNTTDAQGFEKFNPSEAIREDRTQQTLSYNGDNIESCTVSAIDDKPTMKSKKSKIALATSRRQQVLVPLIGGEKQQVELAFNSETHVVKQLDLKMKKSTSHSPKANETALHAVAGTVAEFDETIYKAHPPSEQRDKMHRKFFDPAENSESLSAYTPTVETPQRSTAILLFGGGLPISEFSEKPVALSQGIREQEAGVLSAVAPGTRGWKPGSLCDDSILRYAENENWVGLERNYRTGQVFRQTVTQEEGHFKASGVLMGVRYVVVGSEVLKEPEVRYDEKTTKCTVVYK